ncbi:hypothetical protein PTTG_29329 [Puccinia triticina 1-1 BBBD Race 1]|uniref:CCHC-type domain-containing protein n=1 Tax=Puccinia triticina (isolate 1-1 / race 1 (BBBD)) TaxID=630390 RepID=A0A180G4T6_PUCT1|nr:hypothetical protein PTTG_29329 [Puccinia triticina 1-1 BBBD Race 1]
MKSVLGPQISTNNYFKQRLLRAPAGPSYNKGPSSFFAANWRHTEPAPHVTSFANSQSSASENGANKSQPGGHLDLTSLINELRLQRQSDEARRQDNRARREAEEARTQARWHLDEDSKIFSIVSAAVKEFAAEDFLKPDGSNIQRWEQALRATAAKRFRNTDFFTPGEDKVVVPYHEKIALGIIQSLVHSQTATGVGKAESLSDYNSAAEVLAEFDQCARTFVKQGIDLTWDTIRSFVLQGNLRDHLQPVVNQKVDLFMETHDSMAPGPVDVLRYWDAARTEHQLAEETGRSSTSTLNVTLASQADTSVSGPVSGASSPQDTPGVSAMAVNKIPRCYICKKIGHMSSSCPTSRKNNPDTRQTSQRPVPAPSFPPCSVTYNFDSLPYIKPIQPDPRPTVASTGPYRPPHLPQPKTGNPTQPNKQVNARQINADLFAEEDEDVEYVFENKNLSAKPSGHRFNLCKLAVDREGQEVIWDSGASDNVTGDRYVLFDFKPLEQPIAVKVATDTACDFITGTGTLRFCGMNGVTVAVQNIYYCERAR